MRRTSAIVFAGKQPLMRSKVRLRFLCTCRLSELSTFLWTTACSIANCCRRISRLSLPLGVFASPWVANPRKGRLPPPYRFNCLWACSFHFSFHDLRLLLRHRGRALRARQSHEIPSLHLFIVLPFQHIVEKITEGREPRRQLFLHCPKFFQIIILFVHGIPPDTFRESPSRQPYAVPRRRRHRLLIRLSPSAKRSSQLLEGNFPTIGE